MKQIRANNGSLGEGHVVINEGPDDYVMEGNEIRLKPGEALACVARPEMWQGPLSILYRMSREEAEAWFKNRSMPPHAKPDDTKIERRLYHVFTHGTECRAPVSYVEDDQMFATVPDKELAYMKHSDIANLRDHYRFSTRTNYAWCNK